MSDLADILSQTAANAWTADLPWIDRDDADIEGYVASLKSAPRYDLAQKLRDWRDRGVVIFDGVVDHGLIEALLEDIEVFKRDYGRYKIPIETRGVQIESDELAAFPEQDTGVKINHIHCFSKAAARLSLTPDVVDFLTHIFSGPPSQLQSLTFWRGSQQPIHIDYPYVRQQTNLAYVAASWIPLEDIHPDAGPLGYYPGGHKPEKSGFFDWGGGSIIHDEQSSRSPMEFAEYLWARMKAQGLDRVEFHPRKGDVLIWHGNLPHEGTQVKDPARTRKSYVTHYTAERFLPEWMRPPLATLRGLGVFENGGTSYRYPWFDGRPTLPSWRRG
jgi:phytanoyl-CoA hydroxylase